MNDSITVVATMTLVFVEGVEAGVAGALNGVVAIFLVRDRLMPTT
jgi:hypothetical protein